MVYKIWIISICEMRRLALVNSTLDDQLLWAERGARQTKSSQAGGHSKANDDVQCIECYRVSRFLAGIRHFRLRVDHRQSTEVSKCMICLGGQVIILRKQQSRAGTKKAWTENIMEDLLISRICGQRQSLNSMQHTCIPGHSLLLSNSLQWAMGNCTLKVISVSPVSKYISKRVDS